MPTATKALIEAKLTTAVLDDMVAECRQAGRSWRVIANEVRYFTGVNISGETLRGWYPDLQTQALKSA
jgi:hypothetical protein